MNHGEVVQEIRRIANVQYDPVKDSYDSGDYHGVILSVGFTMSEIQELVDELPLREIAPTMIDPETGGFEVIISDEKENMKELEDLQVGDEIALDGEKGEVTKVHLGASGPNAHIEYKCSQPNGCITCEETDNDHRLFQTEIRKYRRSGFLVKL